MPDAVNRVVPSSVAPNRASWQGRERQKRKEKEPHSGSQPLDELAVVDANGDAEPVRKESKKDNGKHLDISV
jgi:hypothetical protein